MRRVWSILAVAGLGAGCDQKGNGGAAPTPPGAIAGVLEGDSRTVHSPSKSTGIERNNRLPFAFVRGNTDGLDVISEHGKNRVVRGETRQPLTSLAGRGVERVRRVEDLEVTPDVCLVIVDVSFRGGKNAFANAVEPSRPEAPTLVDAQGERYQPVGFAFLDSQWARVRFEPGDPIERVAELPSLSRSRTDQQLWLIYRVSFGRSVRYLARGNSAIFELNPPLAMDVPQGE